MFPVIHTGVSARSESDASEWAGRMNRLYCSQTMVILPGEDRLNGESGIMNHVYGTGYECIIYLHGLTGILVAESC